MYTVILCKNVLVGIFIISFTSEGVWVDEQNTGGSERYTILPYWFENIENICQYAILQKIFNIFWHFEDLYNEDAKTRFTMLV